MPMNFPDLRSLKYAAKVHKFRNPNDKENIDDYRAALANHVKPTDRIESFEILFAVGWDRWTTEQKMQSMTD